MKIVLFILALVNGGFMLIDGIYVVISGKYIGPEKPGPWASVFLPFGVDVFKLGPMFVIFGIAWLAFAFGILTNQNWVQSLGIGLSILTLWYLPFGTIISITALVLLLFFRERLLGN